MFFSRDRIQEIYRAAVVVRANREVLLGGMPPGFTVGLAEHRTRGDQLLSDLTYMNEIEALEDGNVPLRIWLVNAVALFEVRIEARVFKVALRDLDALLGDRRAAGGSGSGGESWLDAPRFRFHEPGAARLCQLLVEGYGELRQTRALAQRVPISLDRWTSDHGIRPAWESLLELAAAQGKLRVLVACVLEDAQVIGFHAELQRLVEGEEARG